MAEPSLRIEIEDGKIFTRNLHLKEGFFGRIEDKKLCLHPIEAFYLANLRRAKIFEGGKEVDPTQFLKKFYSKKFWVKYSVFRDWRDRGLFLNFLERAELKKWKESPVKKYPAKKFELKEKVKLFFLEEEALAVSFEPQAKLLFEKYWIGQWGVYKQLGRGKGLVLDPVETLYLAKKGFEFENGESFEMILKKIKEKIPHVEAMLGVYEDWREKGFVLKTGFKFGTHFRIYFPGASPVKKGKEWKHSKHVIHVFPKEVAMPMSEWARAIRVAHSVRKTFIMAIPGMQPSDYLKEKSEIDFIAWHRDLKTNQVKKPDSNPSFLIICLNEDEKLSGKVLASCLDRADEIGLRLLIAINDRESSVTYYLANRIDLPGSRNKYYEIEWFTP